MKLGSIGKLTIAQRITISFCVWFTLADLLLLFVAYRRWLAGEVFAGLVLALFVISYSAYRLGPVRRFCKRFAREDFCMLCGYSLTGHGSEGVCPECGEDIGESLRLLNEYRVAKCKWYKFIFL